MSEAGENIELEENIVKSIRMPNRFIKKEESKTQDLILKGAPNTAFLITRKLLWHVKIIGLGVCMIDIFHESKKFKKIGKAVDTKVQQLREQIIDE